ncbi:MAG: 30S ribosomal protein S6--L-glutamate ligase, partial [Xanthomonadaceae bacterium]|nr:30S ribosomal protein S6--L-glutamate ligase [Xanthomonadaceae bacterium]
APKGDFRSNLHRGGTAEAVAPSDDERAIAVRAAQVLGLGVAGVDLIRARRGPLVLEVNSSPGLEGIEAATGVDVAGKIIDYAAKVA